jgi:hypothetical protein
MYANELRLASPFPLLHFQLPASRYDSADDRLNNGM